MITSFAILVTIKLIEYFNKGYQNLSLVYDIFCGKKEEIPLYVHQLDKTKYPVLRVKHLVLPDEYYVDYYSEFTLVVDVEGSVSSLTAEDSYFTSYVHIIKNNRITELKLACVIEEPPKIKKNYELLCFLWIDSKTVTYRYDEIILLPYSTPVIEYQPFEVIMKSSLKAISYSDYEEILKNEENDSKFIEMSLSLLLLLLCLI